MRSGVRRVCRKMHPRRTIASCSSSGWQYPSWQSSGATSCSPAPVPATIVAVSCTRPLPALVTLTAIGLRRLVANWSRLGALLPAGLAAGTLSAFALPWLVIAPTYPPPFPVTDAVPPGATPVAGGQFAANVALAAVLFPQSTLTAGQATVVTFYWRVQQPLPDGTWLFVHVVNAAGQTAAAFDGAPLYNLLPLSYWRRGDVVIDNEVLTVHKDAAAGPYRVKVGWYDPKTGARVPLASGGNELLAGTVQVVAAAPSR